MPKQAIQSRYGSTFKVLYPDFPTFDITPHHITITQEIGKQDVVEILYPRFSTFYTKALRTGVPVKIRWNNDKVKGEWYGYVYDVKKNTIQSLNQPIIVRCIGASLSLKEGGSKIWKRKTATDIVTEIAKKFKLKPKVTKHKLIFSQQSLSGHSYWEKIQELASKIGYVAHVTGTELFFHPLDVMIDKFMTTIPVMSYLDAGTVPHSKVREQTLDVFRATLGDYSDMEVSQKKVKNVYGVDPLKAKIYSAKSSSEKVGKNLRKDVKKPLFNQTVSTAVSASKKVAQSLADSHAQFARFVHHATGSGQGDPRIAPYRTIEVDGTGDDTDGFWVIKKVVHFITFDGRYNVEFSCMSDGRGFTKTSATRPSSAGIVPTRNVSQELATGSSGRPTSSRISAPTTLVNSTSSGFKTTPRRWVGN